MTPQTRYPQTWEPTRYEVAVTPINCDCEPVILGYTAQHTRRAVINYYATLSPAARELIKNHMDDGEYLVWQSKSKRYTGKTVAIGFTGRTQRDAIATAHQAA